MKVGAPAVSRYHQIKSVLTVSDQENLKEHDFPVPGYRLATSGYMFLELSQSHQKYLILQFTIKKVQLGT